MLPKRFYPISRRDEKSKLFAVAREWKSEQNKVRPSRLNGGFRRRQMDSDMTDVKPGNSAAAFEAIPGFLPQLETLARLLKSRPESSTLQGLIAGLVAVIGATAWAQIELNAWNQPFYDAIERRDLNAFFFQLGVYGLIAGSLLILNVAQTWLNQTFKMKLRESLTRDLIGEWLAPRRAFLLAGAGEIGENPDQRIHEDAHHLAELTTDLGVGLFQAALLLACFIGVLWNLSSGVILHWQERDLTVPGYMVWLAILYAAVASYGSWRVGLPLVQLNATRYARESDLRFALVHVAESSDGVAVYRGEKEERERLRGELDRLLLVLKQLVGATTRLTWVTAGYGWFTIVAPIVVAAPAYFGGNLSFGGLLMAAGAFTQVQASLRWFVDNAGVIADWRATLFRVGVFRQALLGMDAVGAKESRIELAASDNGHLRLDGVSILSPGGCTRLSETRLDVAPGERVLIRGAARSGKTCLFRAMAGLWPWGAGRIELPVGTMFLPKRPYLPQGSLRDVLAYPAPSDTFSEAHCKAALAKLGLAHLATELNVFARWDKELTDPEQQGVAFARLLLHHPPCVVVDSAIETLPSPMRAAVFDSYEKEFAATSLLSIGGAGAEETFYTRIVDLLIEPGGQRLEPPAKTAFVRPSPTEPAK